MKELICPNCESDNVSVHGDKVQYIVCNDCGYSESAEHEEDIDDFDEEIAVKPKINKTTKAKSKTITKPHTKAKKGRKR